MKPKCDLNTTRGVTSFLAYYMRRARDFLVLRCLSVRVLIYVIYVLLKVSNLVQADRIYIYVSTSTSDRTGGYIVLFGKIDEVFFNILN